MQVSKAVRTAGRTDRNRKVMVPLIFIFVFTACSQKNAVKAAISIEDETGMNVYCLLIHLTTLSFRLH